MHPNFFFNLIPDVSPFCTREGRLYTLSVQSGVFLSRAIFRRRKRKSTMDQVSGVLRESGNFLVNRKESGILGHSNQSRV